MIRAAPANPRLLDLVPFVVCPEANLPHLDPAPLGLGPPVHVDPLRSACAPFLERLIRLDALAFGPEGMPMPRWLFVDGAELPGAIVGLARRAEDASEAARRLFDGRAGLREGELVPLAMYIAIPTVVPGTFFGHNLASLGRRLPDDDLRGLGSLVKALGLAAYRCDRLRGATQWASPALRIHVRLGPLRLLTAWTPAHSDAATLTYEVEVEEPGLLALARDPRGRAPRRAATEHLDLADLDALPALQDDLEAGARVYLVAAPHDGRAPLARDP